MDLYRLVRSKSLWICLGIGLALVALVVIMLNYVTSPEFLQTMSAAGGAAGSAGMHVGVTSPGEAFSPQDLAEAQAILTGTSQITFVGNTMVKGGALALLFVIFMTIFLASEFESGFSKNVFASNCNRLTFLGARLIEIVVLAAFFVIVNLAASFVGAALAGFELTPSPVGEFVLWSALVTLIISALTMISAAVVWFTRKMAAGIVVGVVLVSGMFSAIVNGVLSLFPSISHLGDFLLTSCMDSLGSFGLYAPGALSVGHIAGVGLVFLVVFTALSAIALTKKDI